MPHPNIGRVESIKAALRQRQYMTESEIEALFGHTRDLNRNLREMVEWGMLTRVGNGGHSDPYRYTLERPLP